METIFLVILVVEAAFVQIIVKTLEEVVGKRVGKYGSKLGKTL